MVFSALQLFLQLLLQFLLRSLSVLSVFFVLSFVACSSFSPGHHRQMNSLSAGLEPPEMNKKSDVNEYRNEYIFDWPVDRARLSRGYQPKGRRPHLGIDLAAPRKTSVFSAHQGMVIYAGRDFRGFGNMILIESGHGWATLYAHLDKILVSEGQKIKLGEPIALIGNTGRSTGPHLHFEIRKNKGPVDPLLYLPGGMEASRKIAGKK